MSDNKKPQMFDVVQVQNDDGSINSHLIISYNCPIGFDFGTLHFQSRGAEDSNYVLGSIKKSQIIGINFPKTQILIGLLT